MALIESHNYSEWILGMDKQELKMALEKKKTYDYEIRGEYKCIQERCKTSIMEDGEEI